MHLQSKRINGEAGMQSYYAYIAELLGSNITLQKTIPAHKLLFSHLLDCHHKLLSSLSGVPCHMLIDRSSEHLW